MDNIQVKADAQTTLEFKKGGLKGKRQNPGQKKNQKRKGAQMELIVKGVPPEGMRM